MLFNSYVFVLGFLPIVIFCWYALNHFRRYLTSKVFLIVASLIFYGYYNWSYLIIIVVSVALNYLFSRVLLSREATCMRVRKPVFIVSLMLNIGSLFVFKYFDFFVHNINSAFKTSLPLLHIALPLGISFFTFQQLSYIIDSYKNVEGIRQYHFFDYALFITFFPQLIAGPIVTHDEMVPQFADMQKRKFDAENFSKGLYAFALGLGKKVILADSFGLLVDAGFSDIVNLGSINALLVMLGYTFQIYLDFSGYCDMATGIGKMMNIDITMNFNSPYKAISIVDFWKRWHITLTRFFTRYIYIPLGGNRKETVRTNINILIVFLISGIWHGANWTFIVWGLLHGIANVATREFDRKTGLLSQKSHIAMRVFLWFVTFTFINLTWVVFRAESLAQVGEFYKQLFGWGHHPDQIIVSTKTLLETMISGGFELFIPYLPQITLLVPMGLFAFSFALCVWARNTNEQIKLFRPTAVKAIVTVAILYCCIMSFGGVSSFLYWNF